MPCVEDIRRNEEVSQSEVVKQMQNGPLISDLLTEVTKQHCLSINVKKSCDDVPLDCRNSRTEMCTACPKGPLI